MLVKPAKLLLQISSVKPSQLGLQKQSKSAQNNLEEISQTWSTHSQTYDQTCCNQRWSNSAENPNFCAQICGTNMRPAQTEVFPQKLQSNTA